MKKKIQYIILVLLSLTGCVLGASSRVYKTLDTETPFYFNSEKCVFPNDIRLNPEIFLKEKPLINWVGIIKKIETEFYKSNGIIKVTLSQKYWDYVEDFSIQDEKIFISPHGEGDFTYIRREENATQKILDSIKEKLMINDLAICYGRLSKLSNKTPQIEGEMMRLIPYKYYTTKIMSYKVEKDSLTNITICNDKGTFNINNFKFLKVAKPGQNK